MKKIIIIDGDYFAHRCLGILNQGATQNNLIHENEKMIFFDNLKVQLIKLWEVFQPYFDNFVFVSDGNSWRKQLIFKPYYISQNSVNTGETVITYKGQRQKRKDESEIDYEAFYNIYRKFVEDLSTKCNNVFNTKSLEGDDIITMITEKFKNQKDTQLCIFATDKDLCQLVSSNVFIFRCIKSKEHPDGAFVFHPALYLQQFRNDENPMTMLLPNYRNNFKDLMNINMFDQYSCHRALNHGIELANKFQIILTKIVCGDKSDNIFPLIRWKSKTGTMNYSCTERHLRQSIEECGFKNVDESAYLKILRSENDDITLFNRFISNLLKATKQDAEFQNIDIHDNIILHYKHNKQLVLLRSDYFPQEETESFNTLFENKKSIFENKLNTKDLKSILGFDDTVQINDKVTEMFFKSLA
jgi:5'-3' exonuclease